MPPPLSRRWARQVEQTAFGAFQGTDARACARKRYKFDSIGVGVTNAPHPWPLSRHGCAGIVRRERCKFNLIGVGVAGATRVHRVTAQAYGLRVTKCIPRCACGKVEETRKGSSMKL
jgi:hypothetical protein